MYKEKDKKAVFKTFFKAFLEQNTEQKISFCMQWIYFKPHCTYKCIFCMVCTFHILKFRYKLIKSIAPLGKNPSMKKVAKYLIASGIQKSRKLVYSCCDYSAISFFFFFFSEVLFVLSKYCIIFGENAFCLDTVLLSHKSLEKKNVFHELSQRDFFRLLRNML